MKEMVIHMVQKEEIDCGIACIHMLFRFYGYLLDYEWLRKFKKWNVFTKHGRYA